MSWLYSRRDHGFIFFFELPEIEWMRLMQAPNDMEESTNRILEEDTMLPIRGLASTKSRLIIDCADEDTEAVYTCVAESVKERVVVSTYVNVEGK